MSVIPSDSRTASRLAVHYEMARRAGSGGPAGGCAAGHRRVPGYGSSERLSRGRSG